MIVKYADEEIDRIFYGKAYYFISPVRRQKSPFTIGVIPVQCT